jgi:hypothetical protein
MTLGKSHLMATLPLFLAAVVYNVWYFTKSDDVAASRPVEAPPVPAATSGPSVAGEVPAAVDPASIPVVADVVLDKLPAWRRNPFLDPRRSAPAAVEVRVAEGTPAEPEPDIVVSAIFTSSDGQRAHAKVNGRTVRVGDRVGSATVVEIQQKAIVVESRTLGRRTIGPQRRSLATRAPRSTP